MSSTTNGETVTPEANAAPLVPSELPTLPGLPAQVLEPVPRPAWGDEDNGAGPATLP